MENIFEFIPKELAKELFQPILENPSFKLERIVSKGHCTPLGEWYDQDWNEWAILLKGEAVLCFKGDMERTTMKTGDYLYIPAHRKHRVESTSLKEETVWLALHFFENISGN